MTWLENSTVEPDLVIVDRDMVFPAPLGPTSPAREPAAISRSIPATACFAPKPLRSPDTAMAGSAMTASAMTASPMSASSALAAIN
jgi:hypothetical protein